VTWLYVACMHQSVLQLHETCTSWLRNTRGAQWRGDLPRRAGRGQADQAGPGGGCALEHRPYVVWSDLTCSLQDQHHSKCLQTQAATCAACCCRYFTVRGDAPYGRARIHNAMQCLCCSFVPASSCQQLQKSVLNIMCRAGQTRRCVARPFSVASTSTLVRSCQCVPNRHPLVHV
jgi:hypothetical protein